MALKMDLIPMKNYIVVKDVVMTLLAPAKAV